MLELSMQNDMFTIVNIHLQHFLICLHGKWILVTASCYYIIFNGNIYSVKSTHTSVLSILSGRLKNCHGFQLCLESESRALKVFCFTRYGIVEHNEIHSNLMYWTLYLGNVWMITVLIDSIQFLNTIERGAKLTRVLHHIPLGIALTPPPHTHTHFVYQEVWWSLLILPKLDFFGNKCRHISEPLGAAIKQVHHTPQV